jgi:hypothetical protein
MRLHLPVSPYFGRLRACFSSNPHRNASSCLRRIFSMVCFRIPVISASISGFYTISAPCQTSKPANVSTFKRILVPTPLPSNLPYFQSSPVSRPPSCPDRREPVLSATKDLPTEALPRLRSATGSRHRESCTLLQSPISIQKSKISSRPRSPLPRLSFKPTASAITKHFLLITDHFLRVPRRSSIPPILWSDRHRPVCWGQVCGTLGSDG